MRTVMNLSSSYLTISSFLESDRRTRPNLYCLSLLVESEVCLTWEML